MKRVLRAAAGAGVALLFAAPAAAQEQRPARWDTVTVQFERPQSNAKGFISGSVKLGYGFLICFGEITMVYDLMPATTEVSSGYVYRGRQHDARRFAVAPKREVVHLRANVHRSVAGRHVKIGEVNDPYAGPALGRGCFTGQSAAIGKSADFLSANASDFEKDSFLRSLYLRDVAPAAPMTSLSVELGFLAEQQKSRRDSLARVTQARRDAIERATARRRDSVARAIAQLPAGEASQQGRMALEQQRLRAELAHSRARRELDAATSEAEGALQREHEQEKSRLIQAEAAFQRRVAEGRAARDARNGSRGFAELPREWITCTVQLEARSGRDRHVVFGPFGAPGGGLPGLQQALIRAAQGGDTPPPGYKVDEVDCWAERTEREADAIVRSAMSRSSQYWTTVRNDAELDDIYEAPPLRDGEIRGKLHFVMRETPSRCYVSPLFRTTATRYPSNVRGQSNGIWGYQLYRYTQAARDWLLQRSDYREMRTTAWGSRHSEFREVVMDREDGMTTDVAAAEERRRELIKVGCLDKRREVVEIPLQPREDR